MEQESQALTKQNERKPIDIDMSNGLLPASYNELLQFAALYKESGLAAKSFQTTQQLAIAIAMCMELGRPIITGIQDMAVINGKVGIYGDAALAVVRASGQLDFIKETEEGEPYTDAWTFKCELKRKGSPDSRIGIWTWQDSKRAGFDNPKMRDGKDDPYSPWRRFTRRMMQFKARNFPLRDEFGDLLRGMTTVEELHDIIDITPEPKLNLTQPESNEQKEDIYEIKDPKPESESTTEPPDEKIEEKTSSDPVKEEKESEESPEDEPKTSETDKLRNNPQFAKLDDSDLKIIAEFWWLKEKGLIQWEKENRKDLPNMAPAVKKAFDAKWQKVFNEPYIAFIKSLREDPGAKKEPSKEEEQEAIKDAHVGAILKDELICPHTEKPQNPSGCLTCEDKAKCQPYEEYLKFHNE